MAWTLVAPDGAMHVINTEAELAALCNAQRPPLRVDNMRHLLQLFNGNGRAQHVKGWQRLQDVQWLKRAGCDEFVPVLGGLTYFIETIAAARARVDMPFSKKKLAEHLAHARKHGPGRRGFLSELKWQVVEPPADAASWLLRVATHHPEQPERPALSDERPALQDIAATLASTWATPLQVSAHTEWV